MAEGSAPTSPTRANQKFKIGDMVWAKVKGYPFWPGIVVENPEGKSSRKSGKPSYYVKFFSEDNHAQLSEENVKPYNENRATYVKGCKTSKFKKALELAEKEFRENYGGSNEPELDISISNVSASAVTPSSSESKSAPVFKSKKTNSATATTPKTYSRTPFVKDKRSFESTLSAGEASTSESTPKSSKTEAPEKKRAKSETPSSPRKRVNSSPTKSSENFNDGDDQLNHQGASSEHVQLNKSRGKKQPSNLKYGFIGLGAMGQQVLKHMLQTGHEVFLWNRTPTKCKEFKDMGAKIVDTPGDVIREADITFSCLSDAEAASKIFFGNCGASHPINASKGYVELTSLDPVTSMDIETSVRKKGGRYLEAPVICLIPKQIEEGKCVAMVSGDRSLFDDCSSCFEAICSHVYFLAEAAGAASRLNIVVSTLQHNIIGSLVECSNLVERMGLFPKDFVEILGNSPFSSAFIEHKAQSMLDSTLVRDIPLDHIRRDLNYALNMANVHGYATPITAATNEVFKQKKHHFY